jgi:uncharacterized protein YdeI (YjbR/CyaY-like superfamily)
MIAKADPRVDAYVAKAADFAQPILQHLRQLVHKACPEAEEAIKWGHVSFLYRGKILCTMATFKSHAAFGFWHKDMRAVMEKKFGKTEEAMGSMGRLTSLADLPADREMLQLIKTAVGFHDSGTPSREKPKPKPALENPFDLAAGLAKNKKATVTWEKFTPAQRREYIEWLTEAKREETRTTRLATTLEWLAEGKQRNWKYMNC